MIYTIASGGYTAKINDLGAELTSVQNKVGKEYIFQPSSLWSGQAKNMFPNVGYAKDNYTFIRGKKYPVYQHGFAKDMHFDANKISDSMIEFTIETNRETLLFIPYDFRLTIKFVLKNRKLYQTYRVQNREKTAMHFGIACHTGFVTRPDSYVDFDINNHVIEVCRKDMRLLTGEEREYLLEDGRVPVSPKYFSDGAHILRNFQDKKVTLITPSTDTRIEFRFDDFEFLTLWSTPDAASLLCMMPWCALPDFENTDHIFENKKGNVVLDGKKTYIAVQEFLLH